MRLKCMVVSDMEENCYIVTDESTNTGIIIDPGAEGDSIIKYIDSERIKVQAIVLTHAHYDHIGAVNQVKEHTGAEVICSEFEKVIAENSAYNLSAMLGIPFTIEIDKVLSEGEKYKFGNIEFETIMTPGHTPGGACFYFANEGVLFAGDTLFYMSVGRSDFPMGDGGALNESIKNKLFVLPDYVQVFAGHGQSTTIGFEKENNLYVD